eukprot:2794709-Rhodomonas_salina.1
MMHGTLSWVEGKRASDKREARRTVRKEVQRSVWGGRPRVLPHLLGHDLGGAVDFLEGLALWLVLCRHGSGEEEADGPHKEGLGLDGVQRVISQLLDVRSTPAAERAGPKEEGGARERGSRVCGERREGTGAREMKSVAPHCRQQGRNRGRGAVSLIWGRMAPLYAYGRSTFDPPISYQSYDAQSYRLVTIQSNYFVSVLVWGTESSVRSCGGYEPTQISGDRIPIPHPFITVALCYFTKTRRARYPGEERGARRVAWPQASAAWRSSTSGTCYVTWISARQSQLKFGRTMPRLRA